MTHHDHDHTNSDHHRAADHDDDVALPDPGPTDGHAYDTEPDDTEAVKVVRLLLQACGAHVEAAADPEYGWVIYSGGEYGTRITAEELAMIRRVTAAARPT